MIVGCPASTITLKDISSLTTGWIRTKLSRNDPFWPSLIIVQMVPVRCISRSHMLKIGFRDENFKNLLF